MKHRIIITLLVSVSAVGLLFQFGQSDAVAGSDPIVATTGLMPACVAVAEHAYIGSKKCKMCHSSQYKSWEKTPHANAMDILKPGERKEAKEKYKLDPAKDYTKDKTCLGCHTTGFGKAGGYAIPADGDEKAAKKSAKLAGVGCESCHGPGADANKLKKKIKKEKRKYKFEELEALGATKIEESVCTKCHNDKGPTYDESNKFDFEKAKVSETSMHAHKPLTQREG